MARKPSNWTICPTENGGCGRRVGLQKRYDMQVPQEKQPFVIALHKRPDGSQCPKSRSRVDDMELINPAV
jgi:hypothetical protein